MASSILASHPLASQVGGHAGVLTTEDGSLIIKPALPLEFQFYLAVQQNPDLAALRPFTPNFLGTLKLEGQVDTNKPAEEGITLTPIDTPQKDENVFFVFFVLRITFFWMNTILSSGEPFSPVP